MSNTNTNLNRRDFIRNSTGFLSASALTGLFGDGLWNLRGVSDDRVLVIVQLSGGNDGLSMVVPYGDDAYSNARRRARVDMDGLHKIDNHVALNADLKGLSSLYRDGKMSIIQGVSYPKATRSHFKSMDIWHAGDLRGSIEPYGWVGRFCDRSFKDNTNPNLIVSIGNKTPRAVSGRLKKPVALSSPDAYRYVAEDREKMRFPKVNDAEGKKESSLDFIRRTSREARKSSVEIRKAVERHQTSENYGVRGLANDLKMAASIICSNVGTRVLYVTMGGFDTHNNQKNRHAQLMQQLDQGLTAFQKDLAAHGMAKNVTTMVFSEFGRRVKENASGGTDHGRAGPSLILGDSVKGGLYGKHPSLTDLDKGDLKMTTDFRGIYATLIEKWMGGSARPVLKGQYQSPKFI